MSEILTIDSLDKELVASLDKLKSQMEAFSVNVRKLLEKYDSHVDDDLFAAVIEMRFKNVGEDIEEAMKAAFEKCPT